MEEVGKVRKRTWRIKEESPVKLRNQTSPAAEAELPTRFVERAIGSGCSCESTKHLVRSPRQNLVSTWPAVKSKSWQWNRGEQGGVRQL